MADNHKNVNLTIDGHALDMPAGTTIMQAAEQVDGQVPTICYHPATTPYGICRQCVVEVEGWRILAPACVTPVSDGMVVHTNSPRVTRARRTILEMLNVSVDLSEAPDLQAQLEDYQADLGRFPGAATRQQPVLDDNPFYVRDYQKCVNCWRCVQACADDLQFTYALTLGGRGFETRIATFYDAPMPETTCVFCGNCVAVCPTNALKGKTEFFLQQGLSFEQIRAQKRAGRRQRKEKGTA